MNSGTLIKTSFILSLVLTVTGAYLRITHAEGSDTWLTAAFMVSLVFIGAAVYEVRTSKRIDQMEKMMWTIAFILFSGITCLVYLLGGRKRIISNR